jgi:glycosyltransferase involved in cell wall biosynthesis
VKVAHVITRMIIGGAQENTLYTVAGLKEYGEYACVDLITGPTTGPEGSLIADAGLKEGRDYILVPELIRAISPYKDLLALIRLYRLFRRKKYDVVHTHSSKAGIIGRLAAKMAGVKIIVHTIHGLPFHEYQPRYVNAAYVLLEKIAALMTTRIITVCRVMEEKALKKGVGRKGQFVTIYSGMDLDSFLEARREREKMRESLGITRDEIVIGKIARLFELKGHEYLFQAMKDIIKHDPEARILLVGDGTRREELISMAKELGIYSRVIFAGLVNPQDIPRYLSAMDILVHVSLREGLAKTLPQAMAAGIPVVSFNIDGAREVVENGENGYLVDPGDVPMLRDAILTLMKDGEFRDRLGKYGRNKVDPVFRREYMVRKIHDTYMELMKK